MLLAPFWLDLAGSPPGSMDEIRVNAVLTHDLRNFGYLEEANDIYVDRQTDKERDTHTRMHARTCRQTRMRL